MRPIQPRVHLRHRLGAKRRPVSEVARFVHPDEFAEYKRLGMQMGFRHVESGPLVRSSYHAFEQEQAAHHQHI